MAEIVKAKVASGECATESEVIRDGLRTLLARDRALESWLRDQVGPAFDPLKADPSVARSIGSLSRSASRCGPTRRSTVEADEDRSDRIGASTS
jgi:antitoxin ParD1/3/4